MGDVLKFEQRSKKKSAEELIEQFFEDIRQNKFVSVKDIEEQISRLDRLESSILSDKLTTILHSIIFFDEETSSRYELAIKEGMNDLQNTFYATLKKIAYVQKAPDKLVTVQEEKASKTIKEKQLVNYEVYNSCAIDVPMEILEKYSLSLSSARLRENSAGYPYYNEKNNIIEKKDDFVFITGDDVSKFSTFFIGKKIIKKNYENSYMKLEVRENDILLVSKKDFVLLELIM